MNREIKQDIDQVLSAVVDLIRKQDHARILAWSDRVIHDASIYQDDDTLSIAVLIYAIGNLMQRCSERGEKTPDLSADMKILLKHLRSNNINAFHAKIKQVINTISRQDEKMKLYIQEVIEKAKIRKGSKLHKHGVSMARTAELLGLSQWELQDYIGATEDVHYEGLPVLKRLQRARSVKRIVFDAGPIIAITANNLLWALRDLKRVIHGELMMPLAVKQELVDRGLETSRFKFEALQVGGLVKDGTFSIVADKKVDQLTTRLLDIANHIFYAGKQNIRILDRGEVSALAAAIVMDSDAVAVDERVTRTLLESPDKLRGVMESRLHRSLDVNENRLRQFKNETKCIFVIRSIELATLMFEHGLLDKYVIDIPHAKRELLESILWGMKTEGCSVTPKEIDEIVKSEGL